MNIRHLSRRKKIIAAISSCFLVFFLSLVFFKNGFLPKNAKASDYDVTLSVTPQNTITTEEGTAASPGSDNKIMLLISAKGTISGNLVVHYTTMDRSAVSSLGDYVAAEGEFTLTSQQTSKYVSITVSKATFAEKYNNTYYVNEFTFNITEVEYNGTVDYSSCESTICTIGFIHTLSLTHNDQSANSFYYCMQYDNYISSGDFYLGKVDTDETDTDYFSNSFQTYWQYDYIDTGLAHAYAGFQAKDIEETVNNGDVTDLWFKLYSTKNGGLGTCMQDIRFDGGFKHNNYTYSDEIAYIINNKSKGIIGHHYVNTTKKVLTDPSGNQYLFTQVPASENCKIGVTLYCEDSWKNLYNHWINKARVDECLVDDMLPAVKSNYIDYSHLNIDGKLRIGVRFTEPVQINSSSQVQLKVTIGATTYPLEYEGGSLTDTLYFSLPVTKISYHASHYNIKIIGFNNGTQIGDLAFTRVSGGTNYNNMLASDTYDATLTNSLDLSVPSISISTEQKNVIAASRLSYVTVSDCKKGNLYYKWTDSYTSPYEGISGKPTDYDGVIAISSETGISSYSVTSPLGLNGKYYLHVYVLADNSLYSSATDYRSTGGGTEGFMFDSQAPEVSSYNFTTNTLKEKDISVSVSDGSDDFCSGLSRVLLQYNKIYGDKTTVQIWASTDGTSLYTDNIFKYAILPENLGLGENEYGTYEISLLFYDNADNLTTLDLGTLKFDRRSTFSSEVSIDSKYHLIDTNNDESAYQMSDDNFLITATSNESGDFEIEELIYSGTYLYKDGSLQVDSSVLGEYATITINGSTITIKPKKDGLMNVTFSLDSTKVSSQYSYYLSSNLDDETTNYTRLEEAELLSTKVYQLGSPTYYYLGSSWSDGVQKANYGETTNPASFSSKEIARNYVKYYELQDMYILYLDSSSTNIIKWLNFGGSTEYSKAANETTTAAANQYWIRYKRASWTYSSSTSDWAYYYYGTTNPSISYNALGNSLLINALDTVCDYILNQGEFVYLAGTEYTDSRGVPVLEAAQVHDKSESVTKTFSGSSFTSELVYDGDSSIYSSYYTYTLGATKIQVRYGTNLTLDFNGTNRYYYGRYDAASPYDYSSFKEIQPVSGTYLQDAIPEGVDGVYVILELDSNGINRSYVFLDRCTPKLEARYIANNDNQLTDITYSVTDNNSENGVKALILDCISSSELDEYAYVTIYSYSSLSTSLLKTLLASELASSSLTLDDGNYIIYVSDRSGNAFQFKVKVCSTDLDCSVKIIDGKSLCVTCNRDSSQIYRYEVYLDNKLVTNEYAQKTYFKESGYYYIYIEDIYGNKYENNGDGQGFYFKRNLPDVTWKYNDGTDTYVTYNSSKENLPMMITQVNDSTFYVSTSVQLMFIIDDSLYYKFEGTAPEIKESVQSGSTKVTITSLYGWTLKIGYNEYPDIYSTYVCTFDKDAPTISVTYDTYDYSLGDENAINTFLSSLPLNDDGTVNTSYDEQSLGDYFQTIRYTMGNKNTTTVVSGEVVQAEQFNVSVKDDSGVRNVLVYRDEELINTYESTSGSISSITLDGYGEFQIVATDIFNNKTNMTFENRETATVTRKMDGKTAEINADYDSSICYGNTYDEITVTEDAQLMYIVKKNGVTYRMIVVSYMNNLYLCEYVIKAEEGKVEYTYGLSPLDTIYDSSDTEYKDGTVYPYEVKGYNSDGTQGESLTIYITHNDESYTIRIDADKTAMTIDGSVYLATGSYPEYFRSQISQEVTNAVLRKVEDNDVIETNEDGTLILINDEFKLDENISSDIERIRFAYSSTNSFAGYRTIYYNGEFTPFDTSKDGFYSIQITNIYGNVLTYTLSLSDSFSLTVTSLYDDGTQSQYSSSYSSAIYSNDSILFTIYKDNCEIEVTKDGATYHPEITSEEQSTSFLLNEEGYYIIRIEDEFGNRKTRICSIRFLEFSVSDDILFGYNENATLREENYTNQKLSISWKGINDDNVYYIGIEKDGELIVYYDLSSENQVLIDDASKLLSVVGTRGSGVYNVIFRDIYGNKDVITVHYADEPTLEIQRNTRGNLVYDDLDVQNVIDNGAWSNMSIQLSSSSPVYTLKIDNEEYTLPTTIKFDASTGNGTFSYNVYYKDAYGYEFTFIVHLVRQNIDIDTSAITESKEVDDVLTTRQNISISFLNNITCTYTKDGEGQYSYISGTQISEDGEYVFTLTDYAGNTTTYQIRRDTSVEYQIYDQENSLNLYSGQVTNADHIEFKALNKDTAYIYAAYLNGVKLDTTDLTAFEEDGCYQLMLKDEIGNVSYFEFTILTHELASYTYKVPYNYIISDVWSVTTAGARVSYLESVDVEKGFTISENGTYYVTVSSKYSASSQTFYFVIDSTPPAVELVGCAEGETTRKNITIKGYSVGDTIQVYKNGTLVKEVKVVSKTTSVPTIDEGGDYKIVVTNRAGVSSTLTFTRVYVSNTASTALVFITLIGTAGALFIGMILRNRSKTDR